MQISITNFSNYWSVSLWWRWSFLTKTIKPFSTSRVPSESRRYCRVIQIKIRKHFSSSDLILIQRFLHAEKNTNIQFLREVWTAKSNKSRNRLLFTVVSTWQALGIGALFCYNTDQRSPFSVSKQVSSKYKRTSSYQKNPDCSIRIGFRKSSAV